MQPVKISIALIIHSLDPSLFVQLISAHPTDYKDDLFSRSSVIVAK